MGLNPMIYIILVAICAAVSVITAILTIRAENRESLATAAVSTQEAIALMEESMRLLEKVQIEKVTSSLMSSPTGDSKISMTAVDAIALRSIILGK